MKFIPWKDDNWLSREGSLLPYDKLEHFLISLLGFSILIFLIFLTPVQAIAIGIFAAALWEIKDGVFFYGFSWKDLIAGIAGLLTGFLITIF